MGVRPLLYRTSAYVIYGGRSSGKNLPANYLDSVNEILKDEVLDTLRMAVNKGRPFGEQGWIEEMVDRYSLGHTVRGRGRPRNN